MGSLFLLLAKLFEERRSVMKKFGKTFLCVTVLIFIIISQSVAASPGTSENNVLLGKQDCPLGLQELILKDNSIFGIFEFDGTKIFIETRRGEMISGMKRLMDPTAPLFEIDLRLSDENGFPFFIQFGGHGPIDETWLSESELLLNESTFYDQEISVTKLLENTERMIESLNTISFRLSLLPEYHALMNILPLIKSGITPDKSSGESDSSIQTLTTSSQSIEIWKKGAFFNNNVYGDHSGTVAKATYGGSTYQIWSACNHGTCPGSGMTKKCSKTFSNRPGFCQAPPMCISAYGFFPNQHVCNDDSYIQYWRIKNNANPNTIGGTCADSSLRKNAPDCW